VAVLALTSLLVAADPNHALDATGFQEVRVLDGMTLEVIVAPSRAGPVDVHLYVEAPSAGLTGGGEATGTFSLPGTEIEGVGVRFFPAGRNHFSAIAVQVPIKGTWRLEIAVRVGDFEQRRATFVVPIR
jgi:hypothetical protein